MREMFSFLNKSGAKSKVEPADIDNSVLRIIEALIGNEISNIFDIGACHGRYSLAAIQTFSNAQVHCFEPFPEAFKVLKKNLTNAAFHLNNTAISSEEGEASFYVNENHETNSLLPSAYTNSVIDKLITTKSEITVKVTSIQNYCSRHGIKQIDLLKIDTQGNSFNVLKGCSELLLNGGIKIIQCEVEFLEIYKKQKLFHHIAAFLEQYNYQLYSLYNLHRDVNDRLSWADAIFWKPQ